MAEKMWKVSIGWTVPRAADASGKVSPEDEAAAKERERALNAGEVRPHWWTQEDEDRLDGI